MNLSLNDIDILFEKLAAYCLQEVTLSERIEIEAWIDASSENKKKFLAVHKLLQQKEETGSGIIVDIEKGWTEINTRIADKEERGKAKVRHIKQYMYAAAVVFALICLGSLILFKSKAVDNNWIVQKGFDTLHMPDGTVIIANGTATIKYQNSFNSINREVRLIGNAFFKVHRDTTLPFTVTFDQGRVAVLGTQFFIEQNSNGFDVKVTEGKVKASLLDTFRNVTLIRGEKLSYDKGLGKLVISGFATDEMLLYKNASLQSVLKDIYYAKGILIHPDNRIINIQLTADFTSSSTEEILSALELLIGAELIQTEKNKYQLIKR